MPASTRSRRSLATALALAAVVATAALVLRSPDPGLAADGTAEIPLQASLDSCTQSTHGDSRSCQIAVAFDPLAGAETYEATITAPDGSILLTAPAEPNESVYSVPYVGNGTYGVRVTAFGPTQDWTTPGT